MPRNRWHLSLVVIISVFENLKCLNIYLVWNLDILSIIFKVILKHIDFIIFINNDLYYINHSFNRWSKPILVFRILFNLFFNIFLLIILISYIQVFGPSSFKVINKMVSSKYSWCVDYILAHLWEVAKTDIGGSSSFVFVIYLFVLLFKFLFWKDTNFKNVLRVNKDIGIVQLDSFSTIVENVGHITIIIFLNFIMKIFFE